MGSQPSVEAEEKHREGCAEDNVVVRVDTAVPNEGNGPEKSMEKESEEDNDSNNVTNSEVSIQVDERTQALERWISIPTKTKATGLTIAGYFGDLKHFATGSHSCLYLGSYKGPIDVSMHPELLPYNALYFQCLPSTSTGEVKCVLKMMKKSSLITGDKLLIHILLQINSFSSSKILETCHDYLQLLLRRSSTGKNRPSSDSTIQISYLCMLVVMVSQTLLLAHILANEFISEFFSSSACKHLRIYLCISVHLIDSHLFLTTNLCFNSHF